MSKKTLMSSVRDHFKKWPELNSNKYFGVDYLKETDSCMIEGVPAQDIVKKYVNGDAEKQFVFVFSTKESYGSDVIQNINNLGVYEDLTAWLDKCNEEDNLPELPEGKESLKYEVLTGPYAFNTSDDMAQYQIQLRLVYFEKG